MTPRRKPALDPPSAADIRRDRKQEPIPAWYGRSYHCCVCGVYRSHPSFEGQVICGRCIDLGEQHRHLKICRRCGVKFLTAGRLRKRCDSCVPWVQRDSLRTTDRGISLSRRGKSMAHDDDPSNGVAHEPLDGGLE